MIGESELKAGEFACQGAEPELGQTWESVPALPLGQQLPLTRGFQIFRHTQLSEWPLYQATKQNLEVVIRWERT